MTLDRTELAIEQSVDSGGHRTRNPRLFLWSPLALAVLVLIGLGAHLARSGAHNLQRTERANELASLRSTIQFLDLELTTCAQLSAATGHPRWESRYRVAAPKLDHAIERALSIASADAVHAAVEETETANIALVAMELRAFELVGGGRRDAAFDLLEGAEYASQKSAYSHGMQVLANALAAEIREARAEEEAAVARGVGLVIGAIALLTIVWTSCAKMLHAWREHLMRSNTQLVHRTVELKDLNATLDQRIAERTAELIAEHQQRERAEEESAEAKEFAALVLQHAADPILTVDGRGRIVSASDSVHDVFQWTPDELLGKDISVLIPDELRSEIEGHALALSRGSGLGKVARFEGMRRDGSRVSVELTASRVENTATPLFIGIIRDVSIRLKLEAQLESARHLEALGQLAAGIAHEINTPTQFVSNNILFVEEGFAALEPVLRQVNELARTAPDSDRWPLLASSLADAIDASDCDAWTEEIPQAIEDSRTGLERVTAIVRSMKDFSHPGRNKSVDLDLNRAIESTIVVSSSEWKYVAEIETDLAPDLPLVPCSPVGINQVILGLIVNAAQAISDASDTKPGKGKIAISTERKGEVVEVRVADTGGGIPASARSRIFEPFFTTKDVGSGTGQGLSIAHGIIVKGHGGTLDFETESGKGTTFIIRLPLDVSRIERNAA